MKKITLFIDNLGSGGAQRQIVNLAVLLKQKGYDVSLLVYADVPFYKPLLDQQEIPVNLRTSRSIIGRIYRIRKYLRSTKQDVVIAFLETPGFLACLSKIGGARWKLITSERSAKESTFTNRKNRIYNRFERFSDAKVCNSVNALNLWKKHYPQYSDRYCVIYNPVMIPERYLSAETIQADKRSIVVAASYQELKNPLGVIEALRKLDVSDRERIEIDWYGQTEVTTGNSEIYQEACRRVKVYGLEQSIHLHPATDQIYQHMSESTAVGLFSKVEGLPNTICEAMMLGKPITMSKVSDYNTLVDGNGFLCDPNSYDSICNALRSFLHASDEELTEMGRRSRALAEGLFMPESVVQQWIRLIEDDNGSM